MAQKNATLRAQIGGSTYDLMPKGSVYNIYVDDITTLAQKLQQIVTALNGKVTPEQLEQTLAGFAGGGSGGGGADLLDENGIIKQEYLPDGFPYKSGDDNAVILPSTALEVDPDAGFMIVPEVMEFTLGLEYTVTWNGTAYACPCAEFVDPDSKLSGLVLGNLGALGIGDITDHPFLILAYPKEFADENGFNCAIMPIDGSATATVSIAGFVGNFQRMDATFLPVMEPETVIVTAVGDHGSGVTECSHTYEEMNELAKQGKNLVLDVKPGVADSTRMRFHLVTWGWNNVTFNRFEVTGSSAIIAESIVFYSNRSEWNNHVITSDV